MSETENPEVLGTDRKKREREHGSCRAGKRRGDPGCARYLTSVVVVVKRALVSSKGAGGLQQR